MISRTLEEEWNMLMGSSPEVSQSYRDHAKNMFFAGAYAMIMMVRALPARHHGDADKVLEGLTELYMEADTYFAGDDSDGGTAD